jgi:nitroreductase
MSQLDHEAAIHDIIKSRRSVRHFLDTSVDRQKLVAALEAASWAPSGLNNQPWRFAVVWDSALKDEIGKLTRYATTIRAAAVLVPVFLDESACYDRTKDCQAVGAALQNLLLSCHAQGLGAVWIGEILKNGDRVRDLLNLPDRLELMAVVAIGYPAHDRQQSHRRPLEELIVFER